MCFGGCPGGEIIRVSGTVFALEVGLGRGWRLCGGGEVYLGLYDIVFPVVRHNIDMPWFKNKKGRGLWMDFGAVHHSVLVD